MKEADALLAALEAEYKAAWRRVARAMVKGLAAKKADGQ
jgi:hypothetical protein